MTEKFDRFVVALEALCREHKVQLSTSMYDLLVARDLSGDDEPLWGGVTDETEELDILPNVLQSAPR